jgi:ribonucleoside-diphosphate reductase alpha chain
MEVVKRDGKRESVSFDKITQRLKLLQSSVFSPYAEKPCFGAFNLSKSVRDFSQRVRGSELTHVDPIKIAQRVVSSLYDGVSTAEIDVLSAEIAEGFKTNHPEYGVLASRLLVSNLHKQTPATYLESIKKIGRTRYDAEVYDAVTGTDPALRVALEAAIDDSRSYGLDYFAVKTICKGYLLSVDGKTAERPSHLFMRTSLGIHGVSDVARVLETYRLLSEAFFTHASPTLFNSGTSRPQLASCLMAGTEVYTSEGPKAIEEVEVGDLVITHKGNWKPVTQLHVNQLDGRNIRKLVLEGSPSVFLTGNHKVWADDDEDEEPRWIMCSELEPGSHAILPERCAPEHKNVATIEIASEVRY